jgi:hypothetical protein
MLVGGRAAEISREFEVVQATSAAPAPNTAAANWG